MNWSDFFVWNRYTKKIVPTSSIGGTLLRATATKTVANGSSVDVVTMIAKFPATFTVRLDRVTADISSAFNYHSKIYVNDVKIYDVTNRQQPYTIGTVTVNVGDVIRFEYTNTIGKPVTPTATIEGYLIDDLTIYAESNDLEV